jgi:hypothetical protein
MTIVLSHRPLSLIDVQILEASAAGPAQRLLHLAASRLLAQTPISLGRPTNR